MMSFLDAAKIWSPIWAWAVRLLDSNCGACLDLLRVDLPLRRSVGLGAIAASSPSCAWTRERFLRGLNGGLRVDGSCPCAVIVVFWASALLKQVEGRVTES